MNLLDPETLALVAKYRAVERKAMAQPDPYASSLAQENQAIEFARREVHRLRAEIVSRLLASEEWQSEQQAKTGARFDGPYLGSVLALQFTDLDPESPSKRGSFLVHGTTALAALRARFSAAATSPLAP